MYPNYPTTSIVTSSNAGTYAIVALVLGIIGAILVYFLFMRKENEDKFKGFVKWLYDFLTFKNMTLEFFIKLLYLFFAIYITVYSFSLISSDFLVFLVFLIVGNITVRLIAEGSLLILMIYRRLNDIHKELKGKK